MELKGGGRRMLSFGFFGEASVFGIALRCPCPGFQGRPLPLPAQTPWWSSSDPWAANTFLQGATGFLDLTGLLSSPAFYPWPGCGHCKTILHSIIDAYHIGGINYIRTAVKPSPISFSRSYTCIYEVMYLHTYIWLHRLYNYVKYYSADVLHIARLIQYLRFSIMFPWSMQECSMFQKSNFLEVENRCTFDLFTLQWTIGSFLLLLWWTIKT